MEDYELTYDKFWKDLVQNEDGSLNLDKVMRELHDYSLLLDNVPLVYDYITGGQCSKPFTDVSVVKSLADEHYEMIYQEDKE